MMTVKVTVKVISSLVAMLTSLVPGFALAQAYGAGSFGQAAYNDGVLIVGGVPVTGPTLLGVGGIALISLSIGLAIWAKQHHQIRNS